VSRKLPNPTTPLFALMFVNFLSFVLLAWWLGGDAFNGHERAGKYFLSSKGQLTEVSYAVFLYSKIHIYALFANFALLIISALIFERKKK